MQTNTQKLLQGLVMGDTVSFVTSTGVTCPAILMAAPHPITRNPDSPACAGLYVLDVNSGTMMRDVLFSDSPEKGRWFLSEKQQWMLDAWNKWQNRGLTNALQEQLSEMRTDQNVSTGPTMEATVMGGPIPGGALPEGVSPPREREPEMAGAASNTGTPPP